MKKESKSDIIMCNVTAEVKNKIISRIKARGLNFSETARKAMAVYIEYLDNEQKRINQIIK